MKILLVNCRVTARKLNSCTLNFAETEMSKYYSYEQSVATGRVIVEEEKLLTQLEDEIISKKSDHSEDEIAAVTGMMLMHYKVVNKSELVNNRIALQQRKYKADTPAMSQGITKRTRRKTSSLLAYCRDVLKELLSKNNLKSE